MITELLSSGAPPNLETHPHLQRFQFCRRKNTPILHQIRILWRLWSGFGNLSLENIKLNFNWILVPWHMKYRWNLSTSTCFCWLWWCCNVLHRNHVTWDLGHVVFETNYGLLCSNMFEYWPCIWIYWPNFLCILEIWFIVIVWVFETFPFSRIHTTVASHGVCVSCARETMSIRIGA